MAVQDVNNLISKAAIFLSVASLAWVILNYFQAAQKPLAMTNALPSAPLAKQSAAMTNNGTPLGRNELIQLPNWHLFGEMQEKKTEPEVAVDLKPKIDLSEIPETTISLKLSGIGYSPNKTHGYAIIVTPDGQHAALRVGDEIISNTTVHLIEPRRVVIDRGGVLEALSLPESKDLGGANRSATGRKIKRRSTSRQAKN